MPNDIKLGSNEYPISEDLATVTVGGERSSLEISRPGGGVRVDGQLEVRGNIIGNIVSTDLLIDDIVCDDLSAGGATVNLQNIKLTKNSYDQIITAIDHPETTALQDIEFYASFVRVNTTGFMVKDIESDDALIFKFKPSLSQFLIFPPENADDADYFLIDVDADGVTTISTVDAAGAGADLTVNIDGDITLNSVSGNFITEKNGTEFSPTNSSYAGMLLGYTALLIDDTPANYTVTTTMAVVSDDHKVVFTAPPSGKVEIGVDVFADCGSGGRWMVFGLSSQNATSGYLTVDDAHEHRASLGDETDEIYLHHRWVITGLTAGTEYTYWLGADSQTPGVWVLRWGGTAPGLSAGNYAPFIMKATALPRLIYTGT